MEGIWWIAKSMISGMESFIAMAIERNAVEIDRNFRERIQVFEGAICVQVELRSYLCVEINKYESAAEAHEYIDILPKYIYVCELQMVSDEI